MKHLILHIEESKYKAFLSFIQTLDYVSISTEDEIPQWQQDEVNRRLKLVEKGEMKTRNWEEAKQDIFKK